MTSEFDYYRTGLAGARLKRCYEVAPPRVQQYLDAEIRHVIREIAGRRAVLELGCGYGRVLRRLAPHAALGVGIDNSFESLLVARDYLAGVSNVHLFCMNAAATGFANSSFDAVVCIQNGISAFHVDRAQLVAEALRLCRSGGIALFSSYADEFWNHRLQWFQMQAEQGLVGPIDYARSGDGNIVCTDGFTASRCSADEFAALAAGSDCEAEIGVVDDSSLFCKLTSPR